MESKPQRIYAVAALLLAGTPGLAQCTLTLNPPNPVVALQPFQPATVSLTGALSWGGGTVNTSASLCAQSLTGPPAPAGSYVALTGPVCGNPNCWPLSCYAASVGLTTGGLPAGTYSYVLSASSPPAGFLCGSPSFASTTITLVVGNPPPSTADVVGIMPHAGPTGGGTLVTIAAPGHGSAPLVLFGGTPATSVVDLGGGLYRCTAPARSTVGPVNVFFASSAGGETLPVAFVYVPSVTSAVLSPSTSGPDPFVLTVSGGPFGPTSTVNANGVALTTLWSPAAAGTLTASVPASVVAGAFALVVEVSAGTTQGRASSPYVVSLSGLSNAGRITFSPLRPAPGAAADLLVSGLPANAPFSMAFAVAPSSVAPFPDAVANFGLEVLSADAIFVVDGLGLVDGPPAAADAFGTFSAPIAFPSPALGFAGKLQAVYVDASAPGGFRLTWAYPVTF